MGGSVEWSAPIARRPSDELDEGAYPLAMIGMARARIFAVSLLAFVAAGALMMESRTAGAQSASPESFRVEVDREAPTRGAVAGWVYNDSREMVGLVRMRLEVIDDDGKVVGRQQGWAYGNLRPGDRAYFRIPLPEQKGTRRIIVESFVVQSVQSP